ncbi:hypothetical protein H5410_056601 [Solanum commersonii]|uniref:Uncharacterized protein n=1 Tax=Solanum commersonii TaxID=4109 RepID=A0A9J5WKQ0_SOLCO|nr:hypothetical protein H5410_056601 [Solanum commersonii]
MGGLHSPGSFDLENGPVSPSGPTNSIDMVFTYVHEKKSGSPKDSWTIAHENWQNGRFTLFGARLTLKMGWFTRLDGCPRKSLAKMTTEFWITKRSMVYRTRKSAKWGVYTLWGLFHLENGSVFPFGPTCSIDKVLTDVHKFF